MLSAYYPQVDVLQELVGYHLQRVLRPSRTSYIIPPQAVHHTSHPATVPESHAEPYLEPVDGAAVDERRKHAETIAERVADGTHCEHDVKILLHALYEEVVHRQRRHLKLTTLQCPGEHIDIKKLCTSGFALLFYLPFKI